MCSIGVVLLEILTDFLFLFFPACASPQASLTADVTRADEKFRIFGFVVNDGGTGSAYCLRADTLQDKAMWLKALEHCITEIRRSRGVDSLVEILDEDLLVSPNSDNDGV